MMYLSKLFAKNSAISVFIFNLQLIPAAHADAETLILNPKTVIQLVELKSTKTAESEIKYLQSQFSFSQIDLNYRWKLNLESGFENDRVEPLTSSTFLSSEKYRTDVALTRSFLTGTTIGLQWTQTDFDSQLDSSTLPSFRYNQNLFLFNIEQSLFPNFTGQTERYYFNSFNQEQLAAKIQSEIELEDQKLEGLTLFWMASNAKVNLEESKSIVERYEKLAKTIRTKSNFGYTGPGDLEQALIEFESRKQNLKDDLVNYQKALQSLKDFLGYSRDTELQLQNDFWSIPTQRFNSPILKLKRFQFQQTKADAARALKMYSANKTAAQVSFVGKLAKSGNEPTFSDSLQEITSNSKDRAYVGLKLSYAFDNSAAELESKLRSKQAQLEETKLERKSSDLEEQIKISYEKTMNSLSNIETSKTILSLREKVVNEQTRTFSQGKTDISILIDSINKLSTARINLEKNTNDYQANLVQFLFLTDQSEKVLAK